MTTLVLGVSVALLALGYMLFSQRGTTLSSLWPGKRSHESQLDKYKRETEAERAKSEQLRQLLAAKRVLSQAKAANRKIRKEISAADAGESELKGFWNLAKASGKSSKKRRR